MAGGHGQGQSLHEPAGSTIIFDRLYCMAYTRYTPSGYLIRKARTEAELSQADLA